MHYDPAHASTHAHTQSAYICTHVHIHMYAHKMYNTDMVVPADGD